MVVLEHVFAPYICFNTHTCDFKVRGVFAGDKFMASQVGLRDGDVNDAVEDRDDGRHQ